MVKRFNLGRILYGLLALTVFCAGANAQSGARAPQFTVRTLDGEEFSSGSLHGRVVLLEFWTTRCPDCRKTEAAVGELARSYYSQGLVAIAVDVGEPAARVAAYLKAHPAAVPVAVDQGGKLSARFGKHGVPYCVAIDRDGFIAGSQSGPGGADSLLSLVSLAGLQSRPAASRAAKASPAAPNAGAPRAGAPGEAQGGEALAAPAPAPVSPPKIIELPRTAGTEPQKPSPKTIFVLTNGERLESDKYTMDGGVLQVEVGGVQRAIALNALDLKATEAVNHERGVDLKIPESGSEVYIAF
jgi:thiol-disulfide isomerase/thioredoxin